MRSEEADKRLDRAVELTKELAAAFPTVPQYQALRARALQRYGASLQAPGHADAEPPLREAVALHRSLVAQFPSVPVYQLYLSEACQSLSLNRQRNGDLTETCELLTEAVEAQQRYLKATPANRFGWFTLSHQYQTLADTLRRQGEPEKAAAASRKADEARKGR